MYYFHYMKHLALLTALLLALSCSQAAPEEFHVIPMPNDVTLGEGSFALAGAKLSVDPALDEASAQAVGAFTAQVEAVSGKSFRKGEGGLQFLLNPNLAAEQYAVNITPEKAVVEASGFYGFLYAIQTLKQMLPAEIYGAARAKGPWVLPVVSILDQPRFGYRGMHLDSSRHFWSVEEVKRCLDVMAIYKLNRFHWHLTDDQGWRAEIKAYPRLTEVGAWRRGTMIDHQWDSCDDIRYGGFYTQDEMREVVAYAAERGITVIPEVDLPGHMVAALAAYPELGCTGGPYDVWVRWGVAKDILCAGNDDIFTFIDKVFDELCAIFPSEYVHIGGDECFGGDAEPARPDPWDVCPKCRARMKALGIKPGPEAKHYLQNYVTARVQKILADKGRNVIGWDEILEGELAPGATIMSWRGTQGGIEAAQKGFDAIMTPHTFLYFDYLQSREVDKEPLGIGGFQPVEHVYSYEPFEGMAPGTEDHILGVQANLWTEYITTPEHLEYMLLPRMCALSEVQWCDADKKDYARFDASLDHAFRIFDVLGLTYAKHVRGEVGLPAGEKAAPEISVEKPVEVEGTW